MKKCFDKPSIEILNSYISVSFFKPVTKFFIDKTGKLLLGKSTEAPEKCSPKQVRKKTFITKNLKSAEMLKMCRNVR